MHVLSDFEDSVGDRRKRLKQLHVFALFRGYINIRTVKPILLIPPQVPEGAQASHQGRHIADSGQPCKGE